MLPRVLEMTVLVTFIVAGLLQAGCRSSGDLVEAERLHRWPTGADIRYRAGSWKELLEVARPSATLPRAALVWCKAKEDGWLFDVAHVYRIASDQGESWAIFDRIRSREEWRESDLSGSFTTDRVPFPSGDRPDGPSGYVELVGRAAEWGAVFKVSYTAEVARSAGFQQPTSALLLWHRPDGEWRILCAVPESQYFRMGWYRIGGHFPVRLSTRGDCTSGQLPFRVDIHQSRWESGGNETDGHLRIHLQRDGRLVGSIPYMKTQWETGWYWEVEKGDSWHTIAANLMYFRGDIRSTAPWVRMLKHFNPDLRESPLQEGTKVNVPVERPTCKLTAEAKKYLDASK